MPLPHMREHAGDVDRVEWFGGRVKGGADADAFLSRVRGLAAASLNDLVAADATSAIPFGCVVTVEVPGIPPSESPMNAHLLQVRYAPRFLGGYWGCSHIWDDYDAEDAEAMHATTELSPEQAAEQAVDWLAEQLRRPRARQEWRPRLLRRGAVQWVLTDTGRRVGGRRRSAWGRPAPDRYVEL